MKIWIYQTSINTFTYLFVFQPSSNGSHVFSLSCASSCELWISGDDMEINMSRIIKLEPWESTGYQQWDKWVKFLVAVIQCINKTMTNGYWEITLASIPPLNKYISGVSSMTMVVTPNITTMEKILPIK